MIFELVKDYDAVLESMPADHPRRRILSLLDEAVRRDVHFLDRHPTTLFQCLWNSCWWYDCVEAADFYEEPPEVWRDDPPWSRGEIRLSGLLEDWRARKNEHTPGHVWIRSSSPPRIHLGTAQESVLIGHAASVSCVSFIRGGDRVASGSRDGTIRIWDVNTSEELFRLEGHTEKVWGVATSCDGRRIASGAGDRTLRIWDTQSGVELCCIDGHADSVLSVAFSPTGQRIASGTMGGTIHVWDAFAGKELFRIGGHDGWVNSVSFAPDGARIVSCGFDDGMVRIWDAPTGRQLQQFECKKSPKVSDVAYSPDGRRIVYCSFRTVRVVDLETSLEIHRIEHPRMVWSVAFSPDGRRIVTGGHNGTIWFWDADTGDELWRADGHEGPVSSLAFAPCGGMVASASWDKSVRVWSDQPREPLRRLPAHELNVTALRFSRNGRWLVTGSRRGSIQLWDVPSGRELRRIDGHKGEATCVAFAPDCSFAVSAGRESDVLDMAVRAWDVMDGREIQRMGGSFINECGVSPDGRQVAAGSAGAWMWTVWDLATGRELYRDDDTGILLEERKEYTHAAWWFNAEDRIWYVVPSNASPDFSHSDDIVDEGEKGGPFRVRSDTFETRISSIASQSLIAAIPFVLGKIRSDHSGCHWAGVVNGHLCMFELEWAERTDTR